MNRLAPATLKILRGAGGREGRRVQVGLMVVGNHFALGGFDLVWRFPSGRRAGGGSRLSRSPARVLRPVPPSIEAIPRFRDPAPSWIARSSFQTRFGYGQRASVALLSDARTRAATNGSFIRRVENATAGRQHESGSNS